MILFLIVVLALSHVLLFIEIRDLNKNISADREKFFNTFIEIHNIMASLANNQSFSKQDLDNWVNQQKEHARRLNKLEKT